MPLLIEGDSHGGLGQFDQDQRLPVCSVVEEHGLVEAEPDLVMAVGALEELAADGYVALSGHLMLAGGTGGDVAKTAVWANRWEDGASDVTAILTRLSHGVATFQDVDLCGVAILLEYAVHLVGRVGGELEIRAPLVVTVCSVERVVGIDLHRRVRPEISPDGRRHAEIRRRISRGSDRDSKSHGFLSVPVS